MRWCSLNGRWKSLVAFIGVALLAQCGSDEVQGNPKNPASDASVDAPDSTAVPCTRDQDCVGSDCNAPALCQAGTCAPGTACANPDGDHCAVECVKTPGKAECVVAALDGDDDGHGTQLCAPSPGDDCDDATNAVFTGASELCDGVDNDCDGLVDLDDGLTLGGTPHTVDVAPDSGSVAVTGVDGGHALLFVQKTALAQNGNPNRLLFTDIAGAVRDQLTLDATAMGEPIFSGGSSRVVALGYAAQAAAFELVDVATARRDSASASLSTQAAVSALSVTPSISASIPVWLGIWSQGPSASEPGLFVRIISDVGVLGTPQRILEAAAGAQFTLIHATSVASQLAVAFAEQTTVASPPGVRVDIGYALLDAQFSLVKQDSLDTMDFAVAGFADLVPPLGVRPQVVAVGDRFLVGWFDAARTLNLAAFSSSGALVCGPLTVTSIKGSWSRHHALASAGDEALAVVADDEGWATLHRLNGRCETIGEPHVINAADTELSRGSDGTGSSVVVGLGHPAVAATASGFAVTWVEKDRSLDVDGGPADAAASDASASEHRIMLRTLGARLCD